MPSRKVNPEQTNDFATTVTSGYNCGAGNIVTEELAKGSLIDALDTVHERLTHGEHPSPHEQLKEPSIENKSV